MSEADDPIQTLDRDEEAPKTIPAWLTSTTEAIAALRLDLERIASHLVPLLGEQYRAMEARQRLLEKRIQQRQERPVAVRLAHTLTDLQKLERAEEAKSHAIESLADVLYQMGYEQFGEPGDAFDDGLHEAVSGTVTDGQPIVLSQVFSRGLWSSGDVIVRARVSVGPVEDEMEHK